MTHRSDVVRGRDCSGCTLCCKLLGVEEIGTPPLGWCPHCDTKKGCAIYQHRPTECRNFYCEYLLDETLGDQWKPSKCKLVVMLEEPANDLVVHVDPSRPDAWRREPFYSQIRQWARTAAREQRQVVVWQGDSKIVISPEGDEGSQEAKPMNPTTNVIERWRSSELPREMAGDDVLGPLA
jgi:hypothetical protein